MSDIIHKIIEIYDIYRYFIKFLNFNDKIIFSKLINKNLLKNINFMDKKKNSKNLSELFCICNECFDNLTNNIYHTLTYKYNYFLLNDKENEKYYMENTIYIKSNIIKEHIEYIYSNSYYIAIRSFLEVLDLKKIVLDIKPYECIFHLELKNEIYDLIHEHIEKKYEDGIFNNLLHIFCEKCGNFGHYSYSNKCILYNKKYINKEIKYDVKDTLNDIINNIILINKKDKILEKKKKKICKSCNLLFFNKNCNNKSCGKCCNCTQHFKKIIYI